MRMFWKSIKDIYNKLNKTLLFLVLEVIFLLLIWLFNSYIVVRNFNITELISRTSLWFTLCWVTLICVVLYVLRPMARKIVSILLNICLFGFSLANFFLYAYFDSVFSFRDLGLAGDGFSFISSIFKFINFKLVLVTLMFICMIAVLGLIKTEKSFKIKSWKSLILLSYICISIFILIDLRKNFNSESDGWNSVEVIADDSNYYNNWIDSVRLMKICGIYEFYIRDFYKTYLEKDNISDAYRMVEEYIKNQDKQENKDAKYNGIFKGKNLILVMMESEDDWMVNEKITPTIYEMMQHGFHFTNHYSPGYVTGATSNTEFIINTGQYPSINRLSPHYAYVNNSYPYSVGNLFKSLDYHVNSFHTSNGFIYNRGAMHLSLGYEKYHNYAEMGTAYERLELDTEIPKNAYEKITNHDKFMSFIITYSPHSPYVYSKIECKENLDEIKKLYPNETREEILCSYSASRETDNMFKILLDKLEKDDLLDDTVIVAMSDHPNTIMPSKDGTEKTNNTVFFIYDHTMGEHKIDTITSSINVLPTIINLFGIENDFIYPGYDALNEDNGYVIFKDLTYFDGQEVKSIDKEMNDAVTYSSNLLISDYYKNR